MVLKPVSFMEELQENGKEWESSDFLMAQRRLDRAACAMKIDPDELEPLRQPKRALTVVVPIYMDDGSVRNFQGYRVHHDIALGPAKGGIRFHPALTLGEVATMAMIMTWKCSLMNLPFGGAHGGIRLDPHCLSSKELERVTRRYVSEIIDYLGPDQDIPGVDLYTNQQTMSWIMDTYSINVGHTVPSVVTGKPPSLGGSLGTLRATGYGVAFCCRRMVSEFLRARGKPTAVIQGLGQVGSAVARRLHEGEFTVLGVSEARGGLYSPAGLKIPELLEYVKQTGTIEGFNDAQVVTNEELLELPCDVLAPCAVQEQITAANVGRLRCKLIVEGANAAITAEADEVLEDRGIPVLPDILANSAGVVDGYFEWVQGLTRLFWEKEEIYNRLIELVGHVFDRVVETAGQGKTSLRNAAIQIALARLVEARRLRGLYP